MNIVITPFVLNKEFQNVGLLFIIENNKHLKFESRVQESQWMHKDPWFNTTICTKLIGQNFEDCFKRGKRTGMN